MADRTITVSADRLTSTGKARISVLVGSSSYNSADQAYYWTREWQTAEAEADEEIRRGGLRRFSDVDEAMRWLDSPENV